MIMWIGNIIAKAYRWFWEVLMQRKEPYTYQLTRMMIKHGFFFYLVFLVIQLFFAYHIYTMESVLSVLVGVAGSIFMLWLIDHLNDYSREHPENWPD